MAATLLAIRTALEGGRAIIDWSQVFEESAPRPPLDAAERRRQLDLLRAPLTDEEIAEVASRVGNEPRVENPIARYGFPAELAALYEWCNGGDFSVGEREFAPLFSLAEIREYLVAYGVVHYLPSCIPIGMDGGACFYLLDLSSQPARVLLGGSNELDAPRCVQPLAGDLTELFTDPRAAIEVAGL